MTRAGRGSSLAVLAGVLASCNPVLTPLVREQTETLTAETRPPRVVWVLDASGSLLSPADPTAPACPSGCGPSSPCPVGCQTRKQVVDGWLLSLATTLAPARSGAVLAPTDATCGAPTGWSVAVPAAPSPASLQAVADTFAAVAPLGGTPTAAALGFVATALPDEPGTETFVVLVTDGLPNCNPSNPNHECAGPNPACRCVTSACTGTLCALGCLDDLGTIDASRALSRRGLSLLVVGVGSEVLGAGGAVLSSLETALPRRCSGDTDCRAGTRCTASGVCEERFYGVASPADLPAVTRRLSDALDQSARCTFWLDREVAASDVTVVVGGAALEPGQWGLEAGRRIRLSPATCASLGPAPTFEWRPGSER